ncbi:MAG TPA: ATP-grasp domain-containing protein, partial [Candidatus Kaiserbacteria bacterium]|nr:ATP-grasp domain-containing protein [Candidatus Kaiserbacteria bacterium]
MKKIGIVGGGQLGRMLTQAAHPLGFHVSILDPTPNGPAGLVADKQIVADFKDEASIEKLAGTVDFLTFEIELAAAGVLDKLQKSGVSVNPTGETLSIIKDKLRQKNFLRENKIPVADFKEVSNREDIERVAEIFKYPIVLKARFDAYDGRGNALIET